MRKAAIFVAALAFSLISCNRAPEGNVVHRGRDGHPDQWLYRTSKDAYTIAIDTNGDGRPDVVKTYTGNDLVKIERDRNFNGQADLVQEYSHGVPTREVRDDNFDGKPETIEIYRKGKLAMISTTPMAAAPWTASIITRTDG